ncbi:MAG: polysulfide reductase NrfD [Saprospiraceae bacterium]|nr:polysulfide reductase NrfD [Saprospiraceae bacterium]
MKFGFIIDNRKCIGCHACTTACKSEHEVPVGVFRTWVKQVEKGEFPHTRRMFSVMRCNHCTDAPCVEICPVEALYFRPDGIVDFDKNRCIGCKSCMQACPYDALYIDPDTHTAAKCNYCAHRVDIGLEPACVNVCPEHAIISGDMDNPDSEISQLLGREIVTVRREAKGTHPNLFYIDGDEASLNPIATEKLDYTLWGAQTRGVGHFAKQTEKLAFDNGDLLSALADEKTTGIVAPQKSVDVLMNNGGARRVYDAPNKGLLWGWEVSGYVFTKAISAGVFLVAVLGLAYFNFFKVETAFLEPVGMLFVGVIASLLFLIITTALLVKDLDQPKRFLYVILRPQWNSWLVKGGYALTIFGGALTITLVGAFLALDWLTQIGIVLGVVSGIITAVYTAYLFAQAKGRDFWQSPVLALHMLIHSFVAGAAFFGILALIDAPSEGWLTYLKAVMVIGIAVNLLVMFVELTTTHMTQEAKLTADMITKGSYKQLFWWGVVIMGNLLPLILMLSGMGYGVQIGGLLALIGIYFTEKIWVEAPQRIQLS